MWTRLSLAARSGSRTSECASEPFLLSRELPSYDGNEVTTIVETGSLPTNVPAKITVQYPVMNDADYLGVRGMINRGTLAKRNMDLDRSTPGSNDPTGGMLVHSG